MPKVSGNCQLSNQLSSPFRGEWVQKFPPKDMWKLPTHVRQRIHSGPAPPPKAHRLPASTGKTAPPPSVPVVAAKWCNGCILKPKGGPPHPQAWEPRKPFSPGDKKPAGSTKQKVQKRSCPSPGRRCRRGLCFQCRWPSIHHQPGRDRPELISRPK